MGSRLISNGMNERPATIQFANILLLLNFFVTLHFALGTFVNSSFLEKYVSIEYVGVVFTLAAFIALFFLTQAEKFLVAFGEYKIIVGLLAFDIVGLVGVLSFNVFSIEVNSLGLLFFFLLHYITSVYLIRFLLDVHYEEHMTDEATGFLRGELLTTANLAWILSPLIFSILLGNEEFWKVYAVSLFVGIVILCMLLLHFPRERRQEYNTIFFFETLKIIFGNKNLFRIFMINFLFHIFGSWIIIYLPIHLHETIGMSWETIGRLFTVMLIPYILVDIPLGYAADKWKKEKSILTAGFISVALLTFPLAFITTSSFFMWAVVLTLARFGLAAIELIADTYFFKHVSARDGNLISFFRGAHPLAYIIGPLLSSLLISFGVHTEYLFVILGFIMLSGIVFTIPLRDTF